MHCWSFIARDWLQTTVGLQNCDICQITSNNILPSRVFWESNKTRIAALLSVIYTVNIRAVLPSWALKEFFRFIQPSSNDVTSWKIALGDATFLKACIDGHFFTVEKLWETSDKPPRQRTAKRLMLVATVSWHKGTHIDYMAFTVEHLLCACALVANYLIPLSAYSQLNQFSH